MKIISVTSLRLPEIKIIRFSRFLDSRGYFAEPYRWSDFENHPLMGFMKGIKFLQQNESFSQKNVVRGLHFQWNPYMGKLVRTIQGNMFDMVCDIRKGSATFGKIIVVDMQSISLTPYSEWIWVPPGFAHGNFFTQPTTIEYLCSGEYSPGCEAGISPFAPDIDWSFCDKSLLQLFNDLQKNAIVSDKDKNGLSLMDWVDDSRSENFIY